MWIDKSSLSYTSWNRYTFTKAFPQRLSVRTYEYTSKQQPRLTINAYNPESDLDVKFLRSPNISENISPFSRITAEFISLLHPHQTNNSTQCTAMVLHLVKEPVWVQIPCDKPLLRDWVCKKDLSPKGNLSDSGIQQEGHGIIPDCQNGQFLCHNGECILDIYICDGEVDCVTGEDEENCNVCHENTGTDNSTHYCKYHCGLSQTCTCNFLYYISNSSGCLPYTGTFVAKPQPLYHCNDGKTISEDYVNDLIPDCSSSEDEIDYINLLSQGNVKTCPGDRFPLIFRFCERI